MKKKERVHLKEDPFINFIEKVLEKLKKFKREIIFGVTVCASLAIIILTILFFKSHSISKENKIYSEALGIKNSNTLNIEQKITKLNQLKNKKGISSITKIYLASLYFKSGNYKKAKEIINNFSGSNLKLINDEKRLLEAEILNATSKQREALDILNKLLSDGKSEIAKDYLLLKIAKIQIKSDQKKTAVSNLERLVSEFPESFYSNEAKNLLQILD